MCISKRYIAVLAACAALACVGCQETIFVASRGAYVDTKQYPGGARFRVATSNTFGFWGLLPAAKVVHVDRIVSRAVGKNVKIVSGLKITQYLGLGGALIEVCTLGFVIPRTLVIEGTYHEEGLPTSPAP